MEQQQKPTVMMLEDGGGVRHSNPSSIESSSVLFEKPVPVRIKSPNEDRQAELTIRILMGLSKHRRSTKVLQVQITNELDPFFLYSLEVNEEDFQSLKVEQCILVDFGTFPHKFIELLEYCIRAGTIEAPRFLAILNVRTGDSTFSVVETNQFKHLSHLSLCFRQGNDSTIKSYLAGRLAEYKAANADLHEKLRRTLESLESSLHDVTNLHSELADSKAKHSRFTSDLEAKHAKELACEKEKVMQECLELKARLEREKSEMEHRLLQKVQLQENHVAELDKQVKDLTSKKHDLEIKMAELKTKLDLIDKELQEKQQECDSLRTRNRGLDAELQGCSKKLNDNLIRLAALEQEVQSKNDLISTMSTQLESVALNRAALESSLKDAHAAAERAEEKAAAGLAEANKCNQTIEKLQGELKASKAKLKLKTQVTAQQETLLQERQATIEKNAAENTLLRQEITAMKEDNEVLKKKANDLQKKSEESEEVLKSNQQMIQWLNQQLTDAQLGKYSSKYTPTSRAFSSLTTLPCSNNSGIALASPKAPLLPSNAHNLHHISSPASINSRPSSKTNHHQHHLHHHQALLLSKPALKAPAEKQETSTEDKESSSRRIFTLELTRNGLPKPQLSFVNQPNKSNPPEMLEKSNNSSSLKNGSCLEQRYSSVVTS